ncbi:unnamed protein product [Rhizophagus irregularis]|nr:unnamed protein product [Rhizophagus irregularis]
MSQVKYKQLYARHLIEQFDQDANVHKNKLDIKQAIDYIAEAWENVEQQTICNCWDETGIVSNSNLESIQETRVAIQQGLGVLVNEISNTLPTIFIDNEIQNSLVNYIYD